ncbi:MAG TPA: methyl-accepting chemotaxis protein [Nocardioides sp.]|nr:methyl-accepting chemotaxis protein [Nocardioides sp.]
MPADTSAPSWSEQVDGLVAACHAIADGDLETRLPQVDDPALELLRHAVNRLVDVSDAYVRESAASLRAASDQRFHRQFLVRGMPGAFRSGARQINEARELMRSAAEESRAEALSRAALAERVYDVSSQLAAAATELSASAGSLSDSTRSAVDEAGAASTIVHSLEQTSEEIQHAVTMIRQVADQTRLLSLNATIEAARVGEAGRGFAVVAGEVKTLADEAASSSDDITQQVRRAQEAAHDAVATIERIVALVHEMDGQVAGVAVATGHTTGGGAGVGLSQMAETLRSEIATFVERAH